MMLSRDQILSYLAEINEELRKLDQKGEIGIIGGAVMCIVFNARASTRDIDAIFEPTQSIRQAAAKIAKRHKLTDDWLNDAAKGFLVEGFKKNIVSQFSHLTVWAPEARYMLAMKCLSARWDTHDKEDVIFLLKFLKITAAEKVFEIIEEYYPKNQIAPKTRFFIEEILDNPR